MSVLVATVFRPKRGVRGKTRTGKFWHVRFRLPGEKNFKSFSLGVRDRQVAYRKLDEFVSEKEREITGVGTPAVEREAAKRSLTEHLQDFVRDLAARGRDAMYVY